MGFDTIEINLVLYPNLIKKEEYSKNFLRLKTQYIIRISEAGLKNIDSYNNKKSVYENMRVESKIEERGSHHNHSCHHAGNEAKRYYGVGVT